MGIPAPILPVLLSFLPQGHQPVPGKHPAAAPVTANISADPTARMLAVGDAEQLFVAWSELDEDGDGKGEFGPLALLLQRERLQDKVLGAPDGAGDTYVAGGWLLHLYLPADVDGRENDFALLAWPDQGRAGATFLLRADGRLWCRDDVTVAAGKLPALDQLFAGGVFGAELTAGWREAAASPTAVDAQEVALLSQAEQQGNKADVATVALLLASSSPAVAARAAWLLGTLGSKDSVPALITACSRPEPNVRLQALAALQHLGDARAMQPAIAMLGDADRALRTLAATMLGRLHSKSAVAPLQALLDSEGQAVPDGKPDPVIATLLALSDIGEPRCLMQAASSTTLVDPDVGTALTYLFQTLSPQLPKKEEGTLLLAVLDHPNDLLRRYAIQRLGELKDPATAAAIEGRLANEGKDLQPLLRVTLAAVRGENEIAPETDALTRAKDNFDGLVQRAQQRWSRLSADQRLCALACTLSGAVVLLLLMVLRKRRRRAARADAVAALVAPSAEVQLDADGSDSVGDVPHEQSFARVERRQPAGSGHFGSGFGRGH